MIWNKFKSFCATAALTLLIWLAADQMVTDSTRIEIPVRLVSDKLYVATRDQSPQLIFSVNLTGRRRKLTEFRDQIENRKSAPFESVIDPLRHPDKEPQSISGAEIIRQIHEFATANLSIESITPQTVTVLIDKYDVVPNVTVIPNFGALRVDATCTPTTVSARLPAFAAGSLKNDKSIRVEAETAFRDAKNGNPDAKTLSAVVHLPIELGPGVPVQFTPAEVTLRGSVEALTETRRVGPVQIKFLIPDEVQQKYKVVPKPDANLRPDIDVVGPIAVLARLDPRDVRGLVEIKASDMDQSGQDISRNAIFDLPRDLPGLTLSATAPPQSIVFRLVERGAADAPTE